MVDLVARVSSLEAKIAGLKQHVDSFVGLARDVKSKADELLSAGTKISRIEEPQRRKDTEDIILQIHSAGYTDEDFQTAQQWFRNYFNGPLPDINSSILEFFKSIKAIKKQETVQKFIDDITTDLEEFLTNEQKLEISIADFAKTYCLNEIYSDLGQISEMAMNYIEKILRACGTVILVDDDEQIGKYPPKDEAAEYLRTNYQQDPPRLEGNVMAYLDSLIANSSKTEKAQASRVKTAIERRGAKWGKNFKELITQFSLSNIFSSGQKKTKELFRTIIGSMGCYILERTNKYWSFQRAVNFD